jgi:hypothetical protein
MAAPTGRLRLAPDEPSHSGTVRSRHKTKEWPRRSPDVCRIWCGARPTHNPYEGADMAKNTRGPNPVDRWTRDSGVNITPPTQRTGPATTTPTVA